MDTHMSSTKYIQQEIVEKIYDEKSVRESREMEFVISTATKDRHREVVNMDNWQIDRFNQNPIVGYQHNVYGENMCTPPNPDDVLGKASAHIDTLKGKKVLVSKVIFEPKEINPTADKVFEKLLFGSLNAASVGFLELGTGREEITRDTQGNIKDKTYFYSGQELVEWSVVNIPANADALRRSIKNHTLSALNFVQNILEDYGITEIKNMKVQEILDAIEKKKYKHLAIEEIQEALTGPDPNLNTLKDRLTKIKNGQVKS
jgi:hypothetical protein